jgi:hypothetical protein
MLSKNQMVINGGWNIPRVLASSRILTFIYLPIILISLQFDIQEHNKIGFMVLSIVLLIYLWINLILVAYRALDKNFTGGLKIRKVVTLFIMTTLTYAFFYYAMINYNIFSFESVTGIKKTIEKNPYLAFFDMTFFSSNIITTLGYNFDLGPKTRFLKFIIMTQCAASILLLMVLLSKAI